MLVLVHSSPTSLERDHGQHPNLGVLSCPKRTYLNVDGWPWAADNRAYVEFSPDDYRRMLDRIHGLAGCLFVTAPDVVGDAKSTLDKFEVWYDDLIACWQPIALVGQDGMLPDQMPWARIDALFIGGTSEWKLGPEAADLVREAKLQGKWCHMGRVNTHQRIQYAHALGCDSIDGTNFSMYRQVKLPKALDMCAQPRQMMIT